MKPKATIEIKPQPGPQTQFLSSRADITIFGGAAGGGKTFGLILDPLRHFSVADFGGIIFRRNSKQVRNTGGLWDESAKLYPLLKAEPIESRLEWRFKSGMNLCFDHLEFEKDVLSHQGAQYAYIGFDELTHFTRNQFFYMLSRLRSTCGVKPRIRATTNPDPDSWVRDFISWWIGEDGYAIPERSGVLRWFVRINDDIIWADTKEELIERYGQEFMPMSVTFILSRLADNKILLEKDPAYKAKLLAMSRVDRLRLLGDETRGGNWNVRAAAGMIFKREWFEVVDALPGGWVDVVRFWDRAATKPSEQNRDPDWTRGGLMYKYPNGTFVFADLKSMQDTPGQVEALIKNTASQDGRHIKILAQQDPGSAGVMEAEHFVKLLAGYDVATETYSKDKLTRAKPVSAQAEVGNIKVLRGPWNNEFFAELEGFPDAKHDDIVDTLSGAFNALTAGSVGSFMGVSRSASRVEAVKQQAPTW